MRKLYAGGQIAFFTSSCTGGLKEERSNNIDYRYSKLFTMCSLLSVIPHHLIFTQGVSHAQTCEKLFVHRRMDLPVLLWWVEHLSKFCLAESLRCQWPIPVSCACVWIAWVISKRTRTSFNRDIECWTVLLDELCCQLICPDDEKFPSCIRMCRTLFSCLVYSRETQFQCTHFRVELSRKDL